MDMSHRVFRSGAFSGSKAETVAQVVSRLQETQASRSSRPLTTSPLPAAAPAAQPAAVAAAPAEA